MENSRITVLLDTFSATERTAFRKWLRSPYFNQREDVVALYDLYEQARQKNRPLPDKAILSGKLFPDTPYDDHRIRLAMSLLHRLAEQFLTWESFDPRELAIQQLKMYRTRQLPEHFQRQLKNVSTAHQSQPYRHPDWHWEHFEIEKEGYLFQAATQRTTDLNVQSSGDALDLAFMALKLRHACAALSHQAVFRKQYNLGLLPQVLEAVRQMPWQDMPALALYYTCYLIITEPDQESHFMDFKQMLYRHGAAFPPEEQRDLYLLAINYCIQRYNAGDRRYLEEEMEFYQRGLSTRALFTGDRLSKFTFRNVVTLGLTLGRFDQTEQFVLEYRPFLDPRHRDANVAFNLARLAFERGQHGQVLELLQQSDYDELLLNLAAKALLLKVYFETRAMDALDSHLDAMSNFVRRKKEMSYYRDHYINLCRFTKKLLTLRPDDRAGRAALLADIEATPKLASRDWLTGVINR
jgi:hypothetical protein